MLLSKKNIPITILALSLLFSATTKAQDTIHHSQPHHMPGLPVVPQFPGGKDSLAAFLKKNVHYPTAAAKKHITGKVEVDFWVDEQGNLSKLKVLKPLSYSCDKEALRVVKRMPKWIPGMDGRKPMAMDFHVDITFAGSEKK